MRGETPNYVKNDLSLPQNVPKFIWKIRRSKVKMTGGGCYGTPWIVLMVSLQYWTYYNNPLFIDTMLIYNLPVMILLVSIAYKSVDARLLKVVAHLFLCKFCRKCKLQSMWVPPNWIVKFTVTEFKNEALLKRGISCLWGYAFQVLMSVNTSCWSESEPNKYLQTLVKICHLIQHFINNKMHITS